MIDAANELLLSKPAIAAMALLVNLGARHLVMDLGQAHEAFLSSKAAKRAVLFAVLFLSTRDLLLSAGMAFVYILVVDGMLRHDRRFSLVRPSGGVASQAYLAGVARIARSRWARASTDPATIPAAGHQVASRPAAP